MSVVEPNSENPPRSRNIRLTLAYDGTNYVGWQVQTNGLAIQSVVERAIEKLTGTYSSVLSAGRTDSGVHALGQVASFHTTSLIPPENFRTALQVHLPRDIVILDSQEAPPGFHATFAAKSKRYRYVLYNGMMMLPFLQRFAYHIRKPLDAAAMHEAGQVLLGTHDFRSFETDWPNKATSVRTVMDLTVRRTAVWQPWSNTVEESKSADGEFIVFEVKADGFLYNMVRTIVGTLISVGRGRWSAEDVRQIVAAQDRRKAGNTAPACGLFLVQVDY